MSQLIYGDVDLGVIVHIRDLVREAVLSPDGTTYQWTDWIWDIDTLFNPGSLSYRQPFQVIPNRTDPRQVPGQMPAVTDVALRHYLLQPRRTLIWRVGGATVVQTPRPGYDTDAQAGPTVERCDVTQVHGDRTFSISFRVRARVNEAPTAHNQLPLLLSARWRRWVDTDEHFFSEVITETLAQFRRDELLKRNVAPDQVRRLLAFSVPPNFRRVSVRVVPSEDGSALTIRTVDKEMPLNVPQRWQATRAEAYHTRNAEDPSFLQNLQQQVPGFVGDIVGAALGGFGNAQAGVGGVLGGPQNALQGAANIGQRAMDVVWGTFPTFAHSVLVRVWGHRGSQRVANLQGLAVGIGVARIGAPAAGFNSRMSLVHNVHGKYVEFTMMHSGKFALPLVAPIAGGAAAAALNPFLFVQAFPANDDTVDGGSVFFAGANAQNLPPPNSGGTRGSWLGPLVANALSDPDLLPPLPGPASLTPLPDQLL